MASSCHDARQALLECLADSPCYNSGKSIKECVSLTTEQSGCKELNTALFHCKRGQVCARSCSSGTRLRPRLTCASVRVRQLDMRKRIKGNTYFDGEKGTEEPPPAAEEAPPPR